MSDARPLPPMVLLCLCLAAVPLAGQEAKDKRPPKKAPVVKQTPKVDPMVEAWVISLSKKIADQNQVIRRSAHSALVTVGKPALKHLGRLATSGDGLVAAEAKKIIGRIKNKRAGSHSGRERRTRDPRQGRYQQYVQKMQKVVGQLNLTPESRAKVDAAFTTYVGRMREIGRQIMEGEMDPSERRGAFKEASKGLSETLQGSMTKDQYAKFQEQMQKMRKGRRRPGRADGAR